MAIMMKKNIMVVLFCAVGLLVVACASDNVTERSRLPYIDSPPPPPQAVPPVQCDPAKEGYTTKSLEVTK